MSNTTNSDPITVAEQIADDNNPVAAPTIAISKGELTTPDYYPVAVNPARDYCMELPGNLADRDSTHNAERAPPGTMANYLARNQDAEGNTDTTTDEQTVSVGTLADYMARTGKEFEAPTDEFGHNPADGPVMDSAGGDD